jgi:hypothetical protein
MAYLVTCTFDLENATSQDYQTAYVDLTNLGLKKVILSDQGNQVVAPTTMTIGQFDGQNAAAVRESVRDSVKRAFSSRRFSSEILVVVGGDWAWGAATT